MNTVAQPEIIGIDVSRDWLDLHCMSDDRRRRLPNTDEGHSKLEEIAGRGHPLHRPRRRNDIRSRVNKP